MGHVLLHEHVFEEHHEANHESLLDWARHVQGRFDALMLEREADEFAGCLLVPEAELRIEYDKHYPKIVARFEAAGMDLGSVSPEALRDYLAQPISRVFQVSTIPIEIRLRKYKIVPDSL